MDKGKGSNKLDIQSIIKLPKEIIGTEFRKYRLKITNTYVGDGRGG